MKSLLYGLWIVGFSLFVGLLAYEGFSEVVAALASVGLGVVAVVAWHLVPMATDTVAWAVLFPPADRRPFPRLLRLRWLCESVNTLLPVAQVGGDLVRARLLMREGLSGPMSGASVVVDLTTAVLMQLAFALLGVGLLVARGGDRATVEGLLAGIGIFSLLLGGFYLAQRMGLFGGLVRILERIAAGTDWLNVAGSADALDRDVTYLYGRRRPLLVSCIWRFGAWTLGAGEVWLALTFLSHPVSVVEAVMLEALGNAVRGAAFAVPGALGVQEGGLILLGSLIGIPGETALALSLLKRVRELALGLPGLVVWQVAEGRRWPGSGGAAR